MIPSRQSVLPQQDQADQKWNPTLFTEYPTSSSSRYQSTTNKMVFGLPVIFLGFMLSLGLVGGAALASCECDEQILGKEYCDSFVEQCRRYRTNLEEHRREANNHGYDICNKTSKKALALYASAYEGYDYEVKGWYGINPGQCRRILTESMTIKNYYIYIQHDGKIRTKQEKPFCVLRDENKRFYNASFKDCRNSRTNFTYFEKVEKGPGFIYTIR